MPAMASRGRGRRTINEINMVPFIDVMLVLLIIFMVTAPLITPSQIALPASAMPEPSRSCGTSVPASTATSSSSTARRASTRSMRSAYSSAV